MIVKSHPEFLESSYNMTAVQQRIFWNLVYLLQKEFEEKDSGGGIDISNYINSKIKTKDLRNLLYGNKSNSRIKKALEAIYSTTFAFKDEDYSKKHTLFEKLEFSEDFEYIIIKIKVGYRYLFYPSNIFLVELEKIFRKQKENREKRAQNRGKTTYLSNRTKARNFIMKYINLEDLKEFKKIVDERMVELKEAKKESEKNLQAQ